MTWSFTIHLARSCSCTPCAHNQVFVHTFSNVHPLCTAAALDNRDYSFLQLVCGGLLDSSVSPAFDGKQENRVRHYLWADAAHHRRALPDQQGLNCCLEDRQGWRLRDPPDLLWVGCQLDVVKLITRKTLLSYQVAVGQCRSRSRWSFHGQEPCRPWSVSYLIKNWY